MSTITDEAQHEHDQKFLHRAEAISRLSPDRDTKHGCVLVSANGEIVGEGFNAPVEGIALSQVPLERPQKYAWFIHAEDRAVIRARCNLQGATAFVTGAPCAACFRRLLEVGIKRIVYGQRTSTCLDAYEADACRAMARLPFPILIHTQRALRAETGLIASDCKRRRVNS